MCETEFRGWVGGGGRGTSSRPQSVLKGNKLARALSLPIWKLPLLAATAKQKVYAASGRCLEFTSTQINQHGYERGGWKVLVTVGRGGSSGFW